MIVAGIDIGSRTSKAIFFNPEENKLLGKGWTRTTAFFKKVAEKVFYETLESSGLKKEDIVYIATTGLGRYSVPFRDIQITEITCGAKGASYLFPETRCVLDIGAQNTRAIKVHNNGKVKNFRSNDKCAAGSGSFLVKAAKYLEISLEELGRLSLYATEPEPISSICAVLAESEIINHVSAGKKIEDIARGIHDSLTDRALALLRQIGIEEEITFIGNVARQEGMVASIQEKTGLKVNVPEEPEYVCALGAAILGAQRARVK